MINMTNETAIYPLQIERIQDHPFHIYQTDENAAVNYIINDNLETGKLKVYENLGGILTIQQLTADIGEPANAVLLAEITTGASWQNESVLIHSINCEYGHEYLVKAMLEQVVHYAKFYECYKSVRISAKEREEWFIDAGGILSDFYQKGKTCIYKIR